MRPAPQKPFLLNKVNSQAASNMKSIQGLGGNSLSRPTQGSTNSINKPTMNTQMMAFLKKPSVAGANKLVKENPSLASSGNPFAGKAGTGTGKVKITIRK